MNYAWFKIGREHLNEYTSHNNYNIFQNLRFRPGYLRQLTYHFRNHGSNTDIMGRPIPWQPSLHISMVSLSLLPHHPCLFDLYDDRSGITKNGTNLCDLKLYSSFIEYLLLTLMTYGYVVFTYGLYLIFVQMQFWYQYLDFSVKKSFKNTRLRFSQSRFLTIFYRFVWIKGSDDNSLTSFYPFSSFTCRKDFSLAIFCAKHKVRINPRFEIWNDSHYVMIAIYVLWYIFMPF